jgi:hypothetical protein
MLQNASLFEFPSNVLTMSDCVFFLQVGICYMYHQMKEIVWGWSIPLICFYWVNEHL